MIADELSIRGAKTAADMALTYFSRNISAYIFAPESNVLLFEKSF